MHILEQTVKYLCEQSQRPHDDADVLAQKLGAYADCWPTTEEEAMHVAARVWCRPETEGKTMDAELATAFADVLLNGET